MLVLIGCESGGSDEGAGQDSTTQQADTAAGDDALLTGDDLVQQYCHHVSDECGWGTGDKPWPYEDCVAFVGGALASMRDVCDNGEALAEAYEASIRCYASQTCEALSDDRERANIGEETTLCKEERAEASALQAADNQACKEIES